MSPLFSSYKKPTQEDHCFHCYFPSNPNNYLACFSHQDSYYLATAKEQPSLQGWKGKSLNGLRSTVGFFVPQMAEYLGSHEDKVIFWGFRTKEMYFKLNPRFRGQKS